jgi:N-acetylglucosamine kinase-like BadF-type ATPase
MKYVLGVDGGNTKTHYALFDTEGNAVAFVEAGTASHEQLPGGYDAMMEELRKQICNMLDKCELCVNDIGYAILGLAGADVTTQYAEIRKRISNIGLINFGVYNDAFLGIKAGSEKGYGISSINGTGTSCVGIDRHGKWIQIGGCGYITGDFAGGGYVETAVIRAVYNSIFRCGEKTIMKKMLFEILKITEDEALLDAIYEKYHTGKIRRDLICKIAFEAANKGDKPALDILVQMGRETARSVAGAYRYLDFGSEESIDVVMAGSVYTKGECPVLLETFKKEVAENINCKANFHLLQEPPVAGAVLWALEELKGTVDDGTRSKVREELMRIQKK